MAELKLIEEPLSPWIELKLQPGPLPTPDMIRVRVRPASQFDVYGAMAEGDRRMSAVSLTAALDVIADWDFTVDGKPWPCTEKNKARYARQLKALLACKIKEDAPAEPLKDGEEPKVILPRFAANEILEVALDEKTFLKN